jgi:hypothetical protein
MLAGRAVPAFQRLIPKSDTLAGGIHELERGFVKPGLVALHKEELFFLFHRFLLDIMKD